jgi:hypothetical protein
MAIIKKTSDNEIRTSVSLEQRLRQQRKGNFLFYMLRISHQGQHRSTSTILDSELCGPLWIPQRAPCFLQQSRAKIMLKWLKLNLNVDSILQQIVIRKL